MSDYFLLDPDYKDFDFTDKDKLKFVTVYGMQYGNRLAAMCLLIGCSVFLVVIFAAMEIDFGYWRNSQHTVAKVVQACQGTGNTYTYVFLALDKTGNMHPFTGTTLTDGATPCRKVGDYIRIQYLWD